MCYLVRTMDTFIDWDRPSQTDKHMQKVTEG